VITMFKTIDHLLDLRAALRKLREALSADGIFVVDVVDFRAAYLRNWSIEAATKIDHPFSITEDTAEAFLAQTGFEPMRKAYLGELLVSYVCRPTRPDEARLPSPASVDAFFREARYVQCNPRGRA
jgi:hypothetical protein